MLTVTRSNLSMEVGDLSNNPLLAACAARLSVAVADALVNDPPTIYVAMLRAIREFIPVTGMSLSSIGFPNSDGGRPAPFQDWRIEERSTDGKVKQKRRGTMMAENEKEGVTIEDSLRGAEKRLLEVIAGDVLESSRVFFHWLLFESVGVGICLYRIATAPDDSGAFDPEEISRVEGLAPFLARGIRLDVVFKVRASGYEFFTRRTVELSERIGLTAMEHQVLHRIVTGVDNESIAEQLSITVSTVKTHIGHILQKAGCRNRNALLGRYFSSVEALAF